MRKHGSNHKKCSLAYICDAKHSCNGQKANDIRHRYESMAESVMSGEERSSVAVRRFVSGSEAIETNSMRLHGYSADELLVVLAQQLYSWCCSTVIRSRCEKESLRRKGCGGL